MAERACFVHLMTRCPKERANRFSTGNFWARDARTWDVEFWAGKWSEAQNPVLVQILFLWPKWLWIDTKQSYHSFGGMNICLPAISMCTWDLNYRRCAGVWPIPRKKIRVCIPRAFRVWLCQSWKVSGRPQCFNLASDSTKLLDMFIPYILACIANPPLLVSFKLMSFIFTEHLPEVEFSPTH